LERERERLAEEGRDLTRRVEDTREQLLVTEQEKGKYLEELDHARASAAAERERIRLLQGQMQMRDEALAQTRADLQFAQDRQRAVENERRQLATEVQIRETEKRILEENLVMARTEIETVRLEKEAIHRQTSQLAEGVSVLAESSTALTEEIRQNQPVSPNAIFDDFRGRRSVARFKAVHNNGRMREFSVNTVFVTDGMQTFALLLATDSPFQRSVPLGKMQSVEGSIEVGGRLFEIEDVAILAQDPRVLLVAINSSVISGEGFYPYALARDPLKFPEAVLIANSEEYYGEAGFRLEPGHDLYLSMQSRLFSRLFGEFSPSVSDLVFTKSAEFLGVMVNNRLCLIIDQFFVARNIPLGKQFSPQQAAATVNSIDAFVSRLPEELR
jgi:hypothetical protein